MTLRRSQLFQQLLLLCLAQPALGASGAGTVPVAPVKILAQPLAEWKGEFFDRFQGGLFVKMKWREGAKTNAAVNVQATIYNPLSKKSWVLSHVAGDPDGLPRDLRKLPSGKYLVQQIVVVDGKGVIRTWASDPKAAGAHALVVRRQCLSNLGQWVLAPSGTNGLTVQFSMIPNSYRETPGAKDPSVAAVLDGFTGLIQEKVGGKKVLAGADSDYGSKSQLRATVTTTRQIAMFYALDLFRHNDQSKQVASVLSTYDPNLRQCYTDRLDGLDGNEGLKGTVKFTFLLSRQTRTMVKLKYSGGNANDPKLTECLYNQLSQLQFPVTENMVGDLTYTFDVQ